MSIRDSILVPIATAMLALACSLAAWAQSVSVQVSSQTAYVDEPVRVGVTIENARDFEGPFIGEVDGLEIRRLPGEQNFSSTTRINGRITEKVTVGIGYEIIPKRAGTFVVPAFTIQHEGKELATKPFRLEVTVSEVGDLMRATVRCNPSTIYVGQAGTLALEIAVKRYRDDRLGITLDEASLWSLVNDDASTWGMFGPALQKLRSENRRPRGEIRMIDDVEYVVYTIERPFDPIAAGPPAIGDVRVRMEYPLRLTRGNDVFFENRVSLAESRPVSVRPLLDDVTVLAPPEGGRPASWNGAVGRFKLDVAAKPVDVAVGDPITLTIRITDTSGTAGLEGLQAPTLADQRTFDEGFRVSKEAAAGVVEGRAKIFTQSIRATSDAVTTIPPIEFSFFDPSAGEYRTARSEPLPLRVRPSSVARANIDGADEPDSAAPSAVASPVAGGLVANFSLAEIARERVLAPLDLAIAIVPPLALLVWLAAGPALLRSLSRGDAAKRRIREARSALERSLESDGSSEARERTLLAYLAARVHADGAGFSRGDAIDRLRAAGFAGDDVARCERLLRELERARYGGAAPDPGAIRELVDQLDRTTTVAGGAR
ncbi:MAG: BatD family protein [Planctomycetaceae bacterium]|nr:BatD family protein [Planctomycetaceae bacterium]